MNEESLELDLELDGNENINKSEERIKSLSSKVRDTAKERDTEREARETAEAKATAAEKRAEFLESFAGVSATQPNAVEFKDAIQEKVLAGYTVEDATAAVLVAEGKYTPPAVEMSVEQAAGGSASNPPLQGAEKPVGEMSQEERRAQLIEADKRGEVSQILQRGV